jgi:hypothetical protein
LYPELICELIPKVFEIEKNVLRPKSKNLNLEKPNSNHPRKQPPNKFYNGKTRIGPSLEKDELHNNTSYDMVTKQNKHILTF